MYDTARRVALVKQRVRENTRRRQRREAISLSAACMLLCAALTQAADVAEGGRHLRAAGRGHHPPRHLQSAHRLRRRGAVCGLCPSGAAGGSGKAVRFPLIAEEITEYPLLESCFLAALNFFEKFCVLGESFFDFLYLYK